jgi:hypothetical protein
MSFCLGLRALADLVINWIGGNRLHCDTDVALVRLWLVCFEIDQRIDRQRFFLACGFH